MKSLSFLIKNAGVTKNDINKIGKKLIPEIKHMNFATHLGYLDERASINLPSDKNIIKNVLYLVRRVKPVDNVFVIGMGGSVLGTKAVYEAIKGKFDNKLISRVYFRTKHIFF